VGEGGVGSWLISCCKFEKFGVNSDGLNVIGAFEILNIEGKI